MIDFYYSIWVNLTAYNTAEINATAVTQSHSLSCVSLRRKWIPTKYDATGMHHYTWPSTPLRSVWGWVRQSERGTERARESRRKRRRNIKPGMDMRSRRRGRRTQWRSSCYAKNQEDQTNTCTRTHTCRVNKEEAWLRLVEARVSERCYWGWPLHTNSSDSTHRQCTRAELTAGDGRGR